MPPAHLFRLPYFLSNGAPLAGFARRLHYKRQRTNRDSEEADLFLRNPNISRLSEELSKSCEGKITFEEYEILGSFQTSKTPGND